MSHNPLLIRRLWWLPWAIFFVAAVIGTKHCAEWASADEPKITEGYDPETWQPCPGRKPERVHKRKAVWYCGPDHPEFLRQNEHDAAAKPDKARPSKREASRLRKRREDRGQKRDG